MALFSFLKRKKKVKVAEEQVKTIKVCSRCKIGKFVFEFSESTRTKDGYKSVCNSCEKALKIIRKEKNTKKKLGSLLLKFVDKLENKDEIDTKLREKILAIAVVWNKEQIMSDLIKNIEVFNDYDEYEEEVNFSYEPYIEKFLDKK